MDTVWLLGLNALLLAGLYIRSWFQYMELARIHHYLFNADEEQQERVQEFMQGFAEAFEVFIEEESAESNSQKIKEWDES